MVDVELVDPGSLYQQIKQFFRLWRKSLNRMFVFPTCWMDYSILLQHCYSRCAPVNRASWTKGPIFLKSQQWPFKPKLVQTCRMDQNLFWNMKLIFRLSLKWLMSWASGAAELLISYSSYSPFRYINIRASFCLLWRSVYTRWYVSGVQLICQWSLAMENIQRTAQIAQIAAFTKVMVVVALCKISAHERHIAKIIYVLVHFCGSWFLIVQTTDPPCESMALWSFCETL